MPRGQTKKSGTKAASPVDQDAHYSNDDNLPDSQQSSLQGAEWPGPWGIPSTPLSV